jgi:hypothetical protein
VRAVRTRAQYEGAQTGTRACRILPADSGAAGSVADSAGTACPFRADMSPRLLPALEEMFMFESPAFAACEGHYELRYTGLFNRGRGFAFPCDATGHVDIDALTEQGRVNYFYARTVVGSELSAPVVQPVR